MKSKPASESQSEFARRHNKSRQYVSKLVKEQKLPVTADGRIPTTAGDEAFEQNRGGTMRGPNHGEGNGNGNGRTTLPYVQQKVASEYFTAKLLELKFKRESGLLGSTAEFLALVTTATSNMRTKLRAIPDGIAAELAHTQSPLETKRIVAEAIDEALEEIAMGVFKVK